MNFINNRLNYLIFIALWAISWACSTDSSTTPSYDEVKQAKKDDSLWVAYFSDKIYKDSIKKTASGLFYRISKPQPDSANVDTGSYVYVRYQGRLTNDTVFDSNLYSARAFAFEVGSGAVIKGWDEGIPKFKKGEEGFIYVPSTLAYKNLAQAKIPANSNLIFFVRITNIE